MKEKSRKFERLRHIVVNLPDKTEVFHIYGLIAAGGLAIDEIFFSEDVSRYIKAFIFISFLLRLYGG